MVICVGRGADLHLAQLMPLPLTVSCFSKILAGFTILVPAHPGNPRESPEGCEMDACVCVFNNCCYFPFQFTEKILFTYSYDYMLSTCILVYFHLFAFQLISVFIFCNLFLRATAYML